MQSGTLATLAILSVVGSGAAAALGPMNMWGGGMMSPSTMAGCEAMSTECPQCHAMCEAYISDPAHSDGSTGMMPEECEAMHDQMHEGMMSGGMMPGSCH